MPKKPKILKIRYDITVLPTAPLHFEGTFHKPSHFPSSDRIFENGIYWQSLSFEGSIFGIKLKNIGSIDNPQLKLNIFSSKKISESQLSHIKYEIEYRFDLNTDLKEFSNDCKRDKVLKSVLRRWKGMRVSNGNSLYEFLVIATVLQNATIRRTVKMLENLFQRYGSKINFDGKTLSAFWQPKTIAQASEGELRTLKLGYRAKTFKRQAHFFVSGEIDEYQLRSLGNNELKIKLLDLYGIGPASVNYLLFEVFKRYDTFNYLSPWEQKIYSRILFNKVLVEANTILNEAKTRWGKWNMLAAHYIFEDLFWKRKSIHIPWLEELIRL